jgi:hypothetical protein
MQRPSDIIDIIAQMIEFIIKLKAENYIFLLS